LKSPRSTRTFLPPGATVVGFNLNGMNCVLGLAVDDEGDTKGVNPVNPLEGVVVSPGNFVEVISVLAVVSFGGAVVLPKLTGF